LRGISIEAASPGPPREAQKIFPIQLLENGDVDVARNSKIVAGQKFALLGKVDPNPLNVSPP
jgi:AP-2 complex subunit alpha